MARGRPCWGVNDGLVSVLCIILGVAGAGSGQTAVRLAGVAGMVAGAVSMAAGEWISVTAQVELFKGVLGDLRRIVRDQPGVVIGRLEEMLREAGLSSGSARAAAREVASDEGTLFSTSARRVVGINPQELGSPWTAAVSSFFLFGLGSLAPLLPWFFIGGSTAAVLSIVATGAAAWWWAGWSPAQAAAPSCMARSASSSSSCWPPSSPTTPVSCSTPPGMPDRDSASDGAWTGCRGGATLQA
ncbi:VIT1/CCC1 transporter family protein [Actinomadura sp. KC216]|uniref:VIT1/CCC1 transporter family protein n=1 Tax=Actinomadura sp. KC216 TaxID=2530370 RepID=UPI0014045461|nr:VIT1/CCC1 transporter family protein [Actinomadura sp. KC216]